MQLIKMPLVQKLVVLYKEKKLRDLQKKEKDIVSSVEQKITEIQINKIRDHIKKEI